MTWLAHRPGSLAPLVNLCTSLGRVVPSLVHRAGSIAVYIYMLLCGTTSNKGQQPNGPNGDPNQLDMIMVRWRGSYGNRIMVIV